MLFCPLIGKWIRLQVSQNYSDYCSRLPQAWNHPTCLVRYSHIFVEVCSAVPSFNPILAVFSLPGSLIVLDPCAFSFSSTTVDCLKRIFIRCYDWGKLVNGLTWFIELNVLFLQLCESVIISKLKVLCEKPTCHFQGFALRGEVWSKCSVDHF